MGISVSVELGLNVNRSTSENTFVCLGLPEGAGGTTGGAFSFSLSLPLKARKNDPDVDEGVNVLDEEVDLIDGAGDDVDPYLPPDKFALAGWNVNRGS